MQENPTNLPKINEHTSIFYLGWPIFVETLLRMLLGNVDTLMLSNYSDTAVGSVGNATQILNLLVLTFTIIAGATGVITSQFLGAKQKDKLNEIYTVSITFNLIVGGIISILILVFSRSMFRLMQVPDELLNDAVDYMRIYGGFLFAFACYIVFIQIMRSNGLTKLGMYISLAMNVISIIGNYIVLYGPLKHLDLGVRGVAFSTTISYCTALVISFIVFRTRIKGHIAFRYLKPFPMDTLKKLLRVGIPTAGESLSYSASMLVILAMVNTMGTASINARIFGSLLASFAYLFCMSGAMATQIIVGHCIGADKYDAAYKRVLKTLKPALISSVSIAIINYLISPFTVRLFTQDMETIKLVQIILLVSIFLELGRCVNIVIINSMRAAGDVKFPTYLGLCSMWGVATLFSYVFGIALHWGVIGVWIAMACDEWLRAIVVFIRWKRGGWRDKNIVTMK